MDDLDRAGRRAMADMVGRLSRPGSVFLFWCFHAPTSELPLLSFHGPSRLASAVEPGEEVELFADHFAIEPGPRPCTTSPAACFILTRRELEGPPAGAS